MTGSARTPPISRGGPVPGVPTVINDPSGFPGTKIKPPIPQTGLNTLGAGALRGAAISGGALMGVILAGLSAEEHMPQYNAGLESGVETGSHIVVDGAIGLGAGTVSVWAGVKVGAAIGTALEPGLGTLAGGLIGGAAMFFTALGGGAGLIYFGKSAKDKIFSYIEFSDSFSYGCGLPESVKSLIEEFKSEKNPVDKVTTP